MRGALRLSLAVGGLLLFCSLFWGVQAIGALFEIVYRSPRRVITTQQLRTLGYQGLWPPLALGVAGVAMIAIGTWLDQRAREPDGRLAGDTAVVGAKRPAGRRLH